MKDVEIIKARNVLSSRSRANLAKRLRVAAYCRVSTDSEDQLNSYKSQVQHYTDLIKSKPEWDLAGIYADEAITGTQVTKREDFQRLINDCMNGDVDMIITKSISRFARNTLDTLKYVRMLKEKGIAVFFEEENINTLTMDGELLLVILSSVAQQEVENISANVKKGLKMKMQRGELVGFQGCLGYDYHPEDKSITINEEEAEIVRYIFRRYIEGAGGSVISQELEHLGYKTKRGSTRWAETTVIGIIKNEKYKGDILMGKTFTLDPISKRRLDNFGEEDQFYIRDHHEAIISEEMFEKAQEILKRRAKPRRLGTDGKREKFSRKYAFSCMLECGFCGSTLTRRSWHSGSQYNKVIWQCVTATKKGKKFCPDSKGIAEETIEQAFIESYRLLCQNNKDVLDEFIARTEETLSDGNAGKQLAKVEKDIAALDAKRDKLVDMRLEEIIDKDTYEQKYFDLSSQIEQLQKQREDLQESAETESTMKKRIAEFRKTLEENEVLDTFDRYVFESIVEKVIVGGYDEDGNKDPSMLTFIYKTGFKNSLDGTNFKPPRKNSKTAKQNAGLCSHTTDEAKSMYSYHSNTTMGPVGSFVCTWAIILGYVGVTCFEACAFPTIITYLWPGFLKGYLYTVAGFDIYASWLIVAIVVAFLIMVINIMGAKTAAILQTILTVIIGGAGILLIIASVLNGTVDNLDGQIFAGTTGVSNVKAVLGVAVLSPFYFIGFDVIPQASEEINVPPKKIGKMLILSVILAVIFYSFVILAVGMVLDSGAIAAAQKGTGLVTADAMAVAFRTSVMAKVIIVGGMCGIITSWNSFMIGGSRAMYSMAESYMIPKMFSKLHPKHKTPINALILIGVLTMLAPFAGRVMMVWICDAGNFGCCMAYCMVSLSFLILRKKEPDMPRPYKVKHYKFVGTMAVLMSGFMVCMYCIPGSGGNLILPEWGMVVAWSLLGVVFYAICKSKYKEDFGSLVELISDEDSATLMPEADEEKLDEVINHAIDVVLGV